MKNKTQQTVAIYPGSFDPPTFGHLNIVERGLTIFKKIIIAIAENTSKKSLFSPQERVEILREVYKNNPRVEIDYFHGLLVNYADQKKTSVILRGLRTVADYEYELQMAFSNKSLKSDLETVFLITENRFSHISSTLIKEIAYFGGSCHNLVPKLIEKKIKEKIKLLKESKN